MRRRDRGPIRCCLVPWRTSNFNGSKGFSGVACIATGTAVFPTISAVSLPVCEWNV